MQTRLVDLVLNLLRKAQYQGTTPSADELYFVTDDYGVTSADVTNALGYTPYNATNPNGYTSNIGTVTSVNGTQPDASGNVTIQSGSSRNVGEIVTSTIPLTDAGLHLLDGALLDGNGSYAGFVDYIFELYDSGDYPDLFDTEANWQTAVTTYGVCGKFVFDENNYSVRLPKITGFIEGTTDITALGDLIEAGLPNITGTFSENAGCSDSYGSTSGAFSFQSLGTSGKVINQTTTNYAQSVIKLDASDSNSIYDNSSTVQPQAIKVLYYIVVATSTKTQIQVDIDEIATDLNGKADTDLSNTTPAISFATALNNAGIRTIVETYHSGASWYRVYSDGFCEQGGYITSASGSSISLLKNYADTNYSILLSGSYGSAGTDVNTVVWNNKTTSSFTYYKSFSNGTTWYACGYIN